MRLISTFGFHQVWDIRKGVTISTSTTILKWINMVRGATGAMPKINSIFIKEKEVDTRLSIMVILTTPTWLMHSHAKVFRHKTNSKSISVTTGVLKGNVKTI